MAKFFGQIQLVIEAPDAEVANAVQQRAADFCVDVDEGGNGLGIVTEAWPEGDVEEDEQGHAA